MQSGPPPKPDALRQRRNRRLELAPAGVPVAAGVPEGDPAWLTATHQQWQAFWLDTEDIARFIRPSQVHAVRRLFSLYDEWDRTMAALHGTDEEFSARLLAGSQGQLVLNPLLRQMESLSRQIVALEDRFGFNLQTRQKLGLTELRARTLAQQNAALARDEHTDEPDPRAALLEPGVDQGREAATE